MLLELLFPALLLCHSNLTLQFLHYRGVQNMIMPKNTRNQPNIELAQK
jgi:hypothetical protein